jgi:phosphatidylinositol N-acetylglucosaminyltransferase subunit C
MAARKMSWKKNLYENEGYDDNYTDPSFLKDLQTNINVRQYTFGEAFRGASRLSLQISCVTTFLIIFFYLYTDLVSPQSVFLHSSLATIVGYGVYCTKSGSMSMALLFEDSKTVLTVLVFGYIFSPLLHTLTDSISTDTIFTTTFFVLLLHLVFFDYGLPAFIVSKAISLNAAIFGAICLSSRLSSSFHAFVLLVVSAEFFALSPILVQLIWSPWWLVPSTAGCAYFLCSISLPILATYLLLLVFVNLVCPWIFVDHQKYKNNIHGPWDEAIVDNN